MRPTRLADIVGQQHLTAAHSPFRQSLAVGKLPSCIFWGPPGTGKTTLARLIAQEGNRRFIALSAVLVSIKEVKQMMLEAQQQQIENGVCTVIFIDEIHRFNKAQQDAFLPYVETGAITLIGATTENPSFEVISALLSRVHVYLLKPLEPNHLMDILNRAIDHDPMLAKHISMIEPQALQQISMWANGDARSALNILESAVSGLQPETTLTVKQLQETVGQKPLLFDKSGEQHFNTISALHKSMRNSDVDASLYWLGKMLEAGDDPLYIARRLIRFASEDIGNADPHALMLAVAAKDAVHFLGLPEGKLALAQLVIYLAAAPKSNSVYKSYAKVQKDLRDGHSYPVPLQLCNAVTEHMRLWGYAENYVYAHDTTHTVANIQCLPDQLKDRCYYQPQAVAQEKLLAQRLAWYRDKKKSKQSNQ